MYNTITDCHKSIYSVNKYFMRNTTTPKQQQVHAYIVELDNLQSVRGRAKKISVT